MKTSLIGAGAMGSGIAQVAATSGAEVWLYDSKPEALETCRQQMEQILSRQVEKGKKTRDQARDTLARTRHARHLRAVGDSDLVIQAIVEDLTVKQAVFRELETIVSPQCLLATNTSSPSVTAIAAACQHPERVLGIHFFNPAALMRLVEIVPAVQTHPTAWQRARQLVEGWGKKTVVAKDTPGFIVNRVARPFYGEALRLLEEGVADAATIDWAMTALGGFRMGPFALMDYIGHDVNYTVTETVFRAFYHDDRYRPSFTQKKLVEAGYLGRKTGRGFYAYGEAAHHPEPLQDPSLGRQILDRILIMLINEAADALFLGIASRDDLDCAMTLGVNYPKGLLRWADEIGIATCVARMDRLFAEYRETRYRCSPLLRRMARENQTFY